jgi:hypothetical protein
VGTVAVAVYTSLQASNVTGSLTYAPPTVANVSTPGGRPIEGQFPVEVQGAVGD